MFRESTKNCEFELWVCILILCHTPYRGLFPRSQSSMTMYRSCLEISTKNTVTSKPILPGTTFGSMMNDAQDAITSNVDVRYTWTKIWVLCRFNTTLNPQVAQKRPETKNAWSSGGSSTTLTAYWRCLCFLSSWRNCEVQSTISVGLAKLPWRKGHSCESKGYFLKLLTDSSNGFGKTYS